jgi:hypothetical protein
MKFREIENIENMAASIVTSPVSSYDLEILSEYLEKEKRKQGAKNNPFPYFYEDVISSPLKFDFKKVIGEINFKKASEDALTCLNTCNEFQKISSWAISGWLQNALKFTDHIVLHYIQDYCKEIPKSYSNAGVEKSRYIQLSKMNGDISTAGAELKDLYDLRNLLEHRTKILADGKQELIPPQRNKVRHQVVKLYPDALIKILSAYIIAYPDKREEN